MTAAAPGRSSGGGSGEPRLPVWAVEVRVTPRQGILDPEGQTIQRALQDLGYAGVESVRAGKLFDLRLQASSAAEAEREAKRMCGELITNPVIEDYTLSVSERP